MIEGLKKASEMAKQEMRRHSAIADSLDASDPDFEQALNCSIVMGQFSSKLQREIMKIEADRSKSSESPASDG
jgi:hypothetical protein